MNIGLYQSAAALSALERWQDVVSQNITSGQVTGYRKRTVEFSTQSAGGWQISPNNETSQLDGQPSQPALFPTASNGISFAPGESQPTGRDLDVAIDGEGFFEVKQSDGTTAYTRSGEFSVRSDHTLVNSAGNTVLSQTGQPITLSGDVSKVTINPDGSIVQNGAPVGTLGVVKFADPRKLIPISSGMFLAGQDTPAKPVAKPTLQQGYLEGSNAAPLQEMVNMVLISRAYDANQRVITNADEQMQKELDALG
jgi:flagellar basal body rod protein FlgG